MPRLLKIEQGSGMFGAIERVGDRLINRHSDRHGHWIDVVAGVNSHRFTFHVFTRLRRAQVRPSPAPSQFGGHLDR
jgi:hypothetical protein